MLSIAVAGMWHLGSVTAACLASAGHHVIAIDEDPAVVAELSQGRPPVAEPGLAELIAAQIAAGRLRFTVSFDDVSEADVVWITWDTPVDERDNADVEFVHARAMQLLDRMREDAVLIVSSQMPVGSIARLEREFKATKPAGTIGFACVPENLRLGKALDIFLRPDRVVAGTRERKTREVIEAIYRPFTDRIEWMSVESAEMTKHAINAFLATSICFINEIAAVCEVAGADAAEVERGLKTDQRIGQRAYLHAGGAFAGGTLARDINFLQSRGAAGDGALPLLRGVHESNERQKTWLERRMTAALGTLSGLTVGILGLTYKPGTSTLRRSAAVEAALWLNSRGARVRAFDPQVSELPIELKDAISLAPTLPEVFTGLDALVVMTPWPEFQMLDPELAPPLVFDPGRFLDKLLGHRESTRYYTIGRVN